MNSVIIYIAVKADEPEVINNIVGLNNSMNMELEAEDIHQLLESHSHEPMN